VRARDEQMFIALFAPAARMKNRRQKPASQESEEKAEFRIRNNQVEYRLWFFFSPDS
jgi:hypothetical protein